VESKEQIVEQQTTEDTAQPSDQLVPVPSTSGEAGKMLKDAGAYAVPCSSTSRTQSTNNVKLEVQQARSGQEPTANLPKYIVWTIS